MPILPKCGGKRCRSPTPGHPTEQRETGPARGSPYGNGMRNDRDGQQDQGDGGDDQRQVSLKPPDVHGCFTMTLAVRSAPVGQMATKPRRD